MKRLVGIHGKPHTGKDTFANTLVRYGFKRVGPGDFVKKAAAAMFDIDIENFYIEELKDAYDPYWQMTHREMLQFVGKESSRDVFGEDFWMRHVARAFNVLPDTEPGFVLPDIRYQNEVEWVKDRGGVILYIKRDVRVEASNETHPADQGLPESIADVVIENNGTIKELHDKAVAFVMTTL